MFGNLEQSPYVPQQTQFGINGSLLKAPAVQREENLDEGLNSDVANFRLFLARLESKMLENQRYAQEFQIYNTLIVQQLEKKDREINELKRQIQKLQSDNRDLAVLNKALSLDLNTLSHFIQLKAPQDRLLWNQYANEITQRFIDGFNAANKSRGMDQSPSQVKTSNLPLDFFGSTPLTALGSMVDQMRASGVGQNFSFS